MGQGLGDPEELARIYLEGHCPVPVDLLRRIGEAIHAPPSRNKRKWKKRWPNHSPSRTCRVRPRAPRLTGLSYQMLQYLPEACLRLIFHLLHHLRRHNQYIPAHWKFKGLHGIPKSSIPLISGAKDLWPIGLIEVTRKLRMASCWAGLIKF